MIVTSHYTRQTWWYRNIIPEGGRRNKRISCPKPGPHQQQNVEKVGTLSESDHTLLRFVTLMKGKATCNMIQTLDFNEGYIIKFKAEL